MVLFNKLDVSRWTEGDFSDDDNHRISGTIYTDTNFTSAFNLTGYTLKIRILDAKGNLWVEKTATINSASAGTWYYEADDENDLFIQGRYFVNIQCIKSGTQLTASGYNNSNKIYFQYA